MWDTVNLKLIVNRNFQSIFFYFLQIEGSMLEAGPLRRKAWGSRLRRHPISVTEILAAIRDLRLNSVGLSVSHINPSEGWVSRLAVQTLTNRRCAQPCRGLGLGIPQAGRGVTGQPWQGLSSSKEPAVLLRSHMDGHRPAAGHSEAQPAG